MDGNPSDRCAPQGTSGRCRRGCTPSGGPWMRRAPWPQRMAHATAQPPGPALPHTSYPTSQIHDPLDHRSQPAQPFKSICLGTTGFGGKCCLIPNPAHFFLSPKSSLTDYAPWSDIMNDDIRPTLLPTPTPPTFQFPSFALRIFVCAFDWFFQTTAATQPKPRCDPIDRPPVTAAGVPSSAAC